MLDARFAGTATAAFALAAVLTGAAMTPSRSEPPSDGSLEHYVVSLDDVRQARGDRAWHQFLKTPSLYTGLYVLPAGSEDGQQPHGHDEVYYVLQGRATAALGDPPQTRSVTKGDVIFVRAGVDHRFQDIEDDLHLLVFFSTADPSGEAR